jgi:nitrogen-specific signal transduction histidine kinase
MFLERIKSNRLIILSVIVFLVTGVLILLQLDRQYYQVKKKQIIVDNWEKFFPVDREALSVESRALLLAITPQARAAAERKLRASFENIIQGPTSAYRMALLDQNKDVLLELKQDKILRYNNARNSLFLRDFSGETSLLISDLMQRIVGKIVVSYTTPLDSEEIIELTARYKYYAVLIIAGLIIVYAALLKFLLLPVKRVMGRLDYALKASPEIIKRPRSRLERVYNNLARGALLTAVNQHIKDFISSSATLDTAVILAELPKFIIRLFRYSGVWVFEYKRDPENRYVLVSAFSEEGGKIAKSLTPRLENTLEETLRTTSPIMLTSKLEKTVIQCQDGRKPYYPFVDLINERDDYALVDIMAILADAVPGRVPDRWRLETLGLLCEQVKTGIKTIEMQRQMIFREKSEANINLSRNLGHDLTNIIATGKLDLLTVRDFLSQSETSAALRSQGVKIFQEALANLLNNTKFLQEIVDIYRSFSFIKRPRFEEVNLHELLDDIIRVFQLSISKNITMTKCYHPELPNCRIEQRLVKLAIFNLLTNAIEAIKRKVSTETVSGNITITTDYLQDSDELSIAIKDTGDGIRNDKGELASPLEIDRIFYMGYSTKRNEEGEGLGLNWVWTIISEFHKGRVVARNCAEGGAEFVVYLRRQMEMPSAPEPTQKASPESNG